ncbi:MAG: carboxypeptidase-like regulatory domain-containing protein [Bacteroidia bacterium]
MNMHILRFFLLAILLPTSFAFSQETIANKDVVYQLSGLIISRTSMEPVPYATLQINHSLRGAVSNEQGFFSVPVTEKDTLYFRHLGFSESKLLVKDYLKEYKQEKNIYLYVIQYIKEDTFTLDPVVIFPYKTPEELKTAVLNMDPQGTPDAIARENLSPEIIDAIIKTLPKDAGERLQVGQQMYYDYYRTRSLIPTAGLDPIAAMRLLQYVAEKAKKRKAKDLNYWEPN